MKNSNSKVKFFHTFWYFLPNYFFIFPNSEQKHFKKSVLANISNICVSLLIFKEGGGDNFSRKSPGGEHWNIWFSSRVDMSENIDT